MNAIEMTLLTFPSSTTPPSETSAFLQRIHPKKNNLFSSNVDETTDHLIQSLL